MLEKLKTTDTKKKTLLLCAAWALFAALYIAARLILRQGKLMLFRFNLGFSIEDAGILYSFQTIIVLAVSAVVLIAAVYLLRRELRCEVFFPALALVFGLFYMFTITPLSVPDEVTHFQAIIELTNKLFSKPFDASVGDFTAFSNHNNVCTGYLRIINELFGKAGDTAPLNMSIMGGMWTLTYSLEYVPQIIAYAIAHIFSFNGVTAFMLGRFCNLLFYVACVYLALRLAPRFKLTLGLCSLMPMALQQAASLSYDNFINALCLVLFAALLRLIFGEGESSAETLNKSKGAEYKTYFAALIAAMLLAPAKGIYASFILLFLFVPQERFTGRVKKRGCFLIMLGLCVGFFAAVSVPSMIRILSSTPPSFAAEGGEQYTLRFFLTNPGDALGIFQDSFNLYFSTWLTQAVGQSLSTCNLEIPSWIVPALLAILVLSAQNVEGRETDLPRGMRTALIALCALVVLTFMMTMFLTWISTRDKIILGVQGRYFTPIIPLLLTALSNRTLVLKKDIGKGLSMLSVLLSARVVLAILDYTMFNV